MSAFCKNSKVQMYYLWLCLSDDSNMIILLTEDLLNKENTNHTLEPCIITPHWYLTAKNGLVIMKMVGLRLFGLWHLSPRSQMQSSGKTLTPHQNPGVWCNIGFNYRNKRKFFNKTSIVQVNWTLPLSPTQGILRHLQQKNFRILQVYRKVGWCPSLSN